MRILSSLELAEQLTATGLKLKLPGKVYNNIMIQAAMRSQGRKYSPLLSMGQELEEEKEKLQPGQVNISPDECEKIVNEVRTGKVGNSSGRWAFWR